MLPKSDLRGFAATMKEVSRSAGRHHSIIPALSLGPGGLAGGHSAGAVTGMVETGYGNVFRHVVGVSTGGPVLFYFFTMRQSGGSENLRYSTIYTDEARSRSFFNRGLRVNVPWLIDVFRGSTGKGMVWEHIRSHPTNFSVVATDWETGEPIYLKPESEEELFEALAPVIALPFLSNPFLHKGKLLTDGGISKDPLGIDYLMAQPEPPTHLLVIPNQWSEPPRSRRQDIERRCIALANALRIRSVPKHIRQLIAERHERFYESIKAALARTDVEVFVHWLPWETRTADRDPVRLQALVTDGYNTWKSLLQD